MRSVDDFDRCIRERIQSLAIVAWNGAKPSGRERLRQHRNELVHDRGDDACFDSAFGRAGFRERRRSARLVVRRASSERHAGMRMLMPMPMTTCAGPADSPRISIRMPPSLRPFHMQIVRPLEPTSVAPSCRNAVTTATPTARLSAENVGRRLRRIASRPTCKCPSRTARANCVRDVRDPRSAARRRRAARRPASVHSPISATNRFVESTVSNTSVRTSVDLAHARDIASSNVLLS